MNGAGRAGRGLVKSEYHPAHAHGHPAAPSHTPRPPRAPRSLLSFVVSAAVASSSGVGAVRCTFSIVENFSSRIASTAAAVIHPRVRRYW